MSSFFGSRSTLAKQWLAVAAAANALLISAVAAAASPASSASTIAYVTTDMHWSLYQTPGAKEECPHGLNEYGPREVFASLFPNGGAEAQTHLRREALKEFPGDTTDRFPYRLAGGPTAIGLNLDGKSGPGDFTSPSGEPGIDNQLFRVIGCIRNYRSPEGQLQLFANRNVRNHIYNRAMIEIVGLDSLENDDDVQVNVYRGLDRLLTDASGDRIIPGGTQRVDGRFGKRFMSRLKGRIVDGVLITEPQDVRWPWAIFSGSPGEYRIRDMRLRLVLTGHSAEGLIAGYADVERFYRTLSHWSMHYLAYGQLDPSGFYRELNRLADGFPDETGKMTAISSSIGIKMIQVFIQHDESQLLSARPDERRIHRQVAP